MNFLLQVILALIPLLNLYILKGLVDLVIKHNATDQSEIIKQIVKLVIVQLINAGLNQVHLYLQSIEQQKVTDHIASIVISKAIKVPYAHYENSDYHDSLHQAQHQALYKLPILINAVNQLMQQGLNMLLLSVLFFAIKWYYFFLFLVLGLPLAYVKWYYSNKLNQLNRRHLSLERRSAYLNFILTSLGFAKEVRIFHFGNSFLENFKAIRNKIATDKREISYHNAWAGFWAQVIEITFICYIYFKLALDTFLGLISIGSFVLYFQAFQRLQAALKSFLQALVDLFQLRMFLNDLFLFLDLPENIKHEQQPLYHPGNGLEITNVSFSYPGSQKEVLKNITINCKPGNMIALVGENGSGKSTLVKLLTALYPVQSGSITLHGVALDKIPDEVLRQKISVIFQDFNSYEATVKENIGLGLNLLNDERMVQSATATGANEFIEKLPLGYDTLLGRTFNSSEQLSGGQWQKIALSRALYKKSELIILDEPTSHIDPLAEYKVINTLLKNIGDNIVLLITHRLYNLKKADCIYAMSEGVIVDQGTFDELVSRDGVFKTMYEKQKL